MAVTFFSRWIDHIVGAGPLRSLFQNPRKILRDHIESGMTVLDIGCGKGFFSLEMARMVESIGKVVCVDLQAGAIADLEVQAAKAGLLRRIDTRVCSDHSLEIDDMAGQIDFALAFYVVHHAADVVGLMNEVYRALKPGGRFLIVEPRHHASVDYCEATKTKAQKAGFNFVDNPKLMRDWAAVFVKD